tara:strand:+ start:396 stop:776 length:381 start_codon:yes stop_codon:yes gene_type:complete
LSKKRENMDIVFIKELCIETVIGIYDWERKIKQFVCIDLELGTDISSASDSDVINDTVDYKAVSKELKSFIGDSNFQLIEALAEESVKLIFEKFNVSYVKGRFSKPGAVTGSKEVGVIIERYRKKS